jgi:hypothetical protein
MRTLSSIECKHMLQLDRMEGTRLQARRIASKDPQTLGRQEEPASGNAVPHLAYAQCSQHRAGGSDVFMHESLKCLNNAVNCLRRLKSEAVGELFVRRRVSGLGLIYEGLTETFLQHATPIKLLAQELSSPTISAVAVTRSFTLSSEISFTEKTVFAVSPFGSIVSIWPL